MAVVGFKGDDTKPEDKERGGFERKEAWMSLGLKAGSVWGLDWSTSMRCSSSCGEVAVRGLEGGSNAGSDWRGHGVDMVVWVEKKIKLNNFWGGDEGDVRPRSHTADDRDNIVTI
jgi:hypothetical protein